MPLHQALCSGPRAAAPCSRPCRLPAAPSSTRLAVRVRAQAPEPVSTNTCPTCGVDKSKMPGGCNAEGRIAGGMGAVLSWWPIKAYKPCPALSDAGYEYERKGQATNEVLFGGVSLGVKGAESLGEMKKTAEKGLKLK